MICKPSKINFNSKVISVFLVFQLVLGIIIFGQDYYILRRELNSNISEISKEFNQKSIIFEKIFTYIAQDIQEKGLDERIIMNSLNKNYDFIKESYQQRDLNLANLNLVDHKSKKIYSKFGQIKNADFGDIRYISDKNIEELVLNHIVLQYDFFLHSDHKLMITLKYDLGQEIVKFNDSKFSYYLDKNSKLDDIEATYFAGQKFKIFGKINKFELFTIIFKAIKIIFLNLCCFAIIYFLIRKQFSQNDAKKEALLHREIQAADSLYENIIDKTALETELVKQQIINGNFESDYDIAEFTEIIEDIISLNSVDIANKNLDVNLNIDIKTSIKLNDAFIYIFSSLIFINIKMAISNSKIIVNIFQDKENITLKIVSSSFELEDYVIDIVNEKIAKSRFNYLLLDFASLIETAQEQDYNLSINNKDTKNTFEMYLANSVYFNDNNIVKLFDN